MSTRPTICQVLHTLHVGGAEVLAARLARGLRKHYRFIFACLDEQGTLGQELQAEGFPVHVLGRRPGLDHRCIRNLARLMRSEQVSVVHAHQYTPFFYSLTARLLCRRPGILFTEHGRHFPDYPRRKRMFFNRLLVGRRDRVVAVGEAVRQALITNEGFRPARVQVIYNGVDLTPYSDRPAPGETATRPFTIIQVARLDYLKDHGTALRTLERLLPQVPQARLLLVGEGPERAKIEEHIRQRNLGDHVQLLGLRKDVPHLLAEADVFLLTSISEGIPLTVIEAGAARLPVVATQVGGLAEVVQDGVTGLLAPSGDDQQLAQHLQRLAEDLALRRQLGEQGHARAFSLFAEPLMHSGYRTVYDEMIGATR